MITIPVERPSIFDMNINDTLFKFTFRFNTTWQKWVMTIQDDQANVLLLNKPLTNGVNILAQHDLPITNLHIVNLNKDETEATFNNLGDSILLVSYEAEDEIL